MNTAPASVTSASALAIPPICEQDQEDERVLQEIVVEGREELAPEQRREAPGGHERVGHGSSLYSIGVSCGAWAGGA